MKQFSLILFALLRKAIYSVFVITLIPGLSVAQSQSASIGVSAKVEEPLGVTEIDEKQGHFLFAPALSFAFVLFEDNGIRLSATLQADKLGLIKFDFSGAPFPESYLLNSRKSQNQAPLLTVILTEN